MNIVSLALLFRSPRRSPALALVGSALYLPAAVADSTGLFANLQRPLTIAYLEVVEGVVALAVIILALKLRKENPKDELVQETKAS